MCIRDSYEGIRGIGWAPRVPAARRAAHEAALRRGLPGYEIHPADRGADAFPIVFVEPAEGFDVASRAENRPALERARDSGQAAMGERLILLRTEGQRGFVIFVPVYH